MYREKELRKRMKGNIKFIGELFKQRMLKNEYKIMKNCIDRLYNSGTNEHYETMIELIKTIGQKMEQPRRQEGVSGIYILLLFHNK